MPESWAKLLAGRTAEPGAGTHYNLPEIEESRAKYKQASRAFRRGVIAEKETLALKENGARKEQDIEALNEQLRTNGRPRRCRSRDSRRLSNR